MNVTRHYKNTLLLYVPLRTKKYHCQLNYVTILFATCNFMLQKELIITLLDLRGFFSSSYYWCVYKKKYKQITNISSHSNSKILNNSKSIVFYIKLPSVP